MKKAIRNLRNFGLLAGAIALAVLPVKAATVTENFGYGESDRTLVALGAGAGGWAGPWDGHTRPRYYAGVQLTYDDLNYSNEHNADGPDHGSAGTGGFNVAGDVANRSFETPLDGTIWISALVQRSDETDHVIFWLNQTVNNENYVALRGTVNTNFRYDGDTFTDSEGAFAEGVTHLFLIRINMNVNEDGHDEVRFWIDPDLSDGAEGLGEPYFSGTGADVFGEGFQSIGISFANTAQTNAVFLDAIRISSDADGFERVTSNPPAPAPPPPPPPVGVATLFDNFDYGEERVSLLGLGDDSAGWDEPWAGNATHHYFADWQLTYEDANYINTGNLGGPDRGVAGVGANLPGSVAHRSFETLLNGTIWISALVFRGDFGDTVIFWLDPAESGNTNYVAIRATSNENNNFRYAGDTFHDSESPTPIGLFPVAESHLFLMRIDMNVNESGHDEVRFWLDPDLSGGADGLGTPYFTGTGQDTFGHAFGSVGISFGTTVSDPAQHAVVLDALRISNEPDGFERVTSGEADFAAWIAQFDLPSGQDGPNDDPTGDGIPNTVRYALDGGDPRISNRDILPIVDLQADSGQEYLTLATERNPDAAGVSLVVEVSSNLVTWSSGSEHTTILEDTSTELVVRDNQPIDTTNRRFIRLRVIVN